MLKKSFNEDVYVAFNEYNHSYFYNEKKLENATTFISKFYKKFDAENISQASAKAWGVDQGELKDLWKSNAVLSGEFGTAIHKALEHYDKFQALGKKIQDKKSLPQNYALPKHPVLLSVIEGFLEINKTEGEVIPEAMITDVKNGYCGTADRVVVVDKKNKVCDVEDYKININPEEEDTNLKPLQPFNELTPNKLTKYRLQMSFYANMLQKSGWTVRKLRVYVFEDSWKTYEFDVLKVI